MKRIDGFLDLDNYFKNVPESSKNNAVNGDYDYQYWITIDDTKYFFKVIKNHYAELLAFEVANFLGFKAIPYDLAIYDGEKGVISKNFHKENCRYISAKKILQNYLRLPSNVAVLREMGMLSSSQKQPKYINNLTVLWQAIEQRYELLGMEVNMADIMNKLVDQIIFNVLTLHNDGLPHNLEFEEDFGLKQVNLVPFFDNEDCFAMHKDELYPRSALTTDFNDFEKNNYEILKQFLMISSQEYIEYFLEKFNALTLEAFIRLIEKVEGKIDSEIPQNIKEKYIQNFEFNREQIKLVLEQLNIACKRS